MSVRDIRRVPFCWQDKSALRLLRCHYDGERLKQRSTALAVYLALTEAASNQYSQGQVEVIQMAIADATGTSRSTVKRYLSEFEGIGLIAVERRKLDTGTSLPNIYALLTPPSIGGRYPATAGAGVPSTSERHPSTDGLDQEEPTFNNDPDEEGVQLGPFSLAHHARAVRKQGPGRR